MEPVRAPYRTDSLGLGGGSSGQVTGGGTRHGQPGLQRRQRPPAAQYTQILRREAHHHRAVRAARRRALRVFWTRVRGLVCGRKGGDPARMWLLLPGYYLNTRRGSHAAAREPGRTTIRYCRPWSVLRDAAAVRLLRPVMYAAIDRLPSRSVLGAQRTAEQGCG
jgi:hypothetical protein